MAGNSGNMIENPTKSKNRVRKMMPRRLRPLMLVIVSVVSLMLYLILVLLLNLL